MKEAEDIIKAYERVQQTGIQAVLATVVHVEGSSYRRPGARMLVTEEGEMTGAISGGCLEGDALKKALLAIHQQQNKLVVYDTTDEDDAKLGVQLGCNGIVYILFEPLTAGNPHHAVALLQKALSKREAAVLVTLFHPRNTTGSHPGTCLLYQSGEYYGTVADAAMAQKIKADIVDVYTEKVPRVKQYTSGTTALQGFIELLQPPVSLVIAGAGNDAIPLADMAAILGWRVTVIDGRATHAGSQRFTKAHQIIVARPAEAIQKINIDERTVFVLMTHNYNYDIALLQLLLQRQCTYIGTLGPASKLERMYDELEQQGYFIPPSVRARVYGPVGLEIGAETAEEIALSIMAEIKMVLEKQTGTSLRDKRGAIHNKQAIHGHR